MAFSLGGKWEGGISWIATATDKPPPRKLVTAVFCLAITEENRIVLARSKRGWGLLGGHVEKGEPIEQALVRESVEEGGFTPIEPKLFAVMKIVPKSPVLRPNSTSDYYPFPESYQLYYWAKSELPITAPTGLEIIESKAFTMKSIEQLDTPDLPLAKLGYEAFQSSI